MIVSADQAIPLALLMNELITNSAKYGRTGKLCSIWIEVRAGEDEVVVDVRDAGPGLPDGFTLAGHKGLGMRLMKAFAEQLRGKLEVKTGAGARFTVSFPQTS